MEVRLQKYLADAGVASRRKAEELIAQGKVKVNGKVVTEMGCKIDPKKDEVTYLDKKIDTKETKMVYIMLNKPVGYVTTAKEQFGRPAVVDLVRGVNERIFPVGRLDYDTSGLLLLTNDGDLTYKLTHPKHDVDKTYIAKLYGIPDEGALQKFRRGVTIDGVKTKPAKIQIIEKDKDGRFCTAEIIIHEGRNRQVRRMLDSVGANVMSLKRISVGSLTLGNLPEGKWRRLSDAEINKLRGKNK